MGRKARGADSGVGHLRVIFPKITLKHGFFTRKMTVRRAPKGDASSVHALRDQIAVITGASSGIGKAIALGLAGEGA
jgi:hypothetical protein